MWPFPQRLGAEVAKRVKASWQAATAGGNSGGTAVLEEGGSFTPLAFSSVDSQFVELWALSLTEVARILRVPPVLLMDYSRQTWANAETGGQQFLTYSLAPWLSRWEAEVTLKLIAPDDRQTIFVEHLTDALLKADFASRATAYGQYRSMSMLMQLAVKWKFRSDNPMLMADRVQHKSKGYETWTDQDIDMFRAHWVDNTPQRIAFEILLYTGLRRSDAVKIGRQHIQGHYIVLTTQKSGGTVQLNIPIHADFRKVLDGIKHNHLNLIVTAYGAARSEKAFTNWMIEAAREAQLPPHRSPHGLRKAACRLLAEAGCSALEIMSITGHKNLTELEVYCAAANQKKLANSAIAKLKSVS